MKEVAEDQKDKLQPCFSMLPGNLQMFVQEQMVKLGEAQGEIALVSFEVVSLLNLNSDVLTCVDGMTRSQTLFNQLRKER